MAASARAFATRCTRCIIVTLPPTMRIVAANITTGNSAPVLASASTFAAATPALAAHALGAPAIAAHALATVLTLGAPALSVSPALTAVPTLAVAPALGAPAAAARARITRLWVARFWVSACIDIPVGVAARRAVTAAGTTPGRVGRLRFDASVDRLLLRRLARETLFACPLVNLQIACELHASCMRVACRVVRVTSLR